MPISLEAGARANAIKLLNIILVKDVDRLARIDDYMNGHHDDPYMPDTATAEYKLLAEKSVDNWFPLLVSTPAQALYVDNFRPSRELDVNEETETPEWKHWQESRLDSRQSAVYRGALIFGHSFTVTERVRGKVITKGLSARKTAGLYEDAANDEAPRWALTIRRQPKDKQPGIARMWSDKLEYEVKWLTIDKPIVTAVMEHGASSNPVTRFAADVDLEGRTMGVVEPFIEIQNRINQTVFDMLVTQTGGAFNTKYVTGMAPPMKMRVVNEGTEDEEMVPELDDNGAPIPLPVQINGKQILYGESPDTKFGSLPATSLSGYIEALDNAVRHLASRSQTPPHHMLGQIANLSADALQAAETSLARKVQEFRSAFGESWERVFRLAAELTGTKGADDFSSEVIWRDMESRSLAATADALGKLRTQIGAPEQGLWEMVPGMTKNQLNHWVDLKDSEPELALAGAITKATAPPTTTKPVIP